MMPRRLDCVAALALLSSLFGGCVSVSAQEIDAGFKPELVAAEFTSRQIRPGDPFAMTLRFRNAGTKPARADYRVFVHFEAPEATCTDIVFQDDHEPAEPTSTWQPGQVVVDGPRILTAPEGRPDQAYFVHVGIFDAEGTGQRLMETYAAGKIEVTASAPAAASIAPEALSAAEVAKRRSALADRIPAADRVSLDALKWRFDLDRKSGAWMLTDKATNVVWTSDPIRRRFADVTLRSGDRSVIWHVDGFDDIGRSADRLRLVTRPMVDGAPSGVAVIFTVEPMTDPDGVRVAYQSEASGDWRVARVRLLAGALGVTEADAGIVYVPDRLGIELRADDGLPGSQQWRTYDSLSMAMCGAVKQGSPNAGSPGRAKQAPRSGAGPPLGGPPGPSRPPVGGLRGSALLVNWENVDTTLTVNTSWPDDPLVPGRRMRALSLDISAPDGMCTIHPLGRGGYVEIAHAYRALARAKGWLTTWAEKRRQFPTVDRMFGAANFKPFVLSRVVPSSRFSSDGKEHVFLGFTFDEVAKCAEHWRNDLGIDRAYVVMAGWINGGYDVRHPDILPAAPECGGNDALRDAFGRIKRCGYLVGMHDNYQDMYEDAASWDLRWLNKTADGTPKRGGNWNGGQAWQVCAIEQVALAERKDTNLPKVAELFGPTIYFIDTTFAWGLVTCEDPNHPMTRQDDLEWKTKLCLLAKQHFGLFGSEEGREWSVPCADYLEGIFGHQTDSPPGSVIPLFPLVYSDCVQIMTHQGNRIGPGDERKMADHILFAEMDLPSFGNHLYWTAPVEKGVPIVPLSPVVKDLGDRKLAITYRWKVDGPVTEDHSVFVHFTHKAATRAEGIAYQDDHMPAPATSQWKAGAIVEDGPRTVEVPAEFDGPAQVLVGMTSGGDRVRLSDAPQMGLRYDVGTLDVTKDGIRFEPAEAQAGELWSRGDGGWGEDLCPTDRVIKNTWEVLSALNVLTAETPLTSHEFLTEDRLLQRTRFGDVAITVAYEKPGRIGDNAVPPYGFIVESPTFIAFCATRYNGLSYATPTLFTARSLDAKPIAESAKVRIYHGFGDPRIILAGKTFRVAREQVVSLR